jgi:hypothetical protein
LQPTKVKAPKVGLLREEEVPTIPMPAAAALGATRTATSQSTIAACVVEITATKIA